MPGNISLKSKASKLEGVPELVNTLKQIAATMEGSGQEAFVARLKDIFTKPANVIRDEARDLVPVVTGKLRDAIISGPLLKRVGAIAWVKGVYYAPYVEYGTEKTAAHPYFRPAINAVRPMAANMMAGDMKELIADVATANAFHPPT